MVVKTADETDEKSLRKYLLGDASQDEMEAIDLWLISVDDAYDLLAAAEDDIIDDWIGGRLSRPELYRFTTHFLLAPERREKLRFGILFHRAAANLLE